ncbi:endonuclease domain-containing protein [Roseiarcus sp.]|uniref:endonuclease domain-containing protein n=1 Tax=Roseiarcus sp. TaxID=1969460 RepID=UPI003D0E0778
MPGGFIADFACFGARLIIEVDGATHSTDGEMAYDAARSAALAARGCVSPMRTFTATSTASWRRSGGGLWN